MAFILLRYTTQRFLLKKATIAVVLPGFSLKVSFLDLSLKMPSSFGKTSCLLGSTNYRLIVLSFLSIALGYTYLSGLIHLHAGRGSFWGHSLRFARTAGGFFLSCLFPWFFLIPCLAYDTACWSLLRGVIVFESTLRLELAHTLFQMKSVPLGRASELSFLTVCLSWADSPSQCSGYRAEQACGLLLLVSNLSSVSRLGWGRLEL